MAFDQPTLPLSDAGAAQAIDWDEHDAARQAARRAEEQAAYLARRACFDALPCLYRDALMPSGPDEPSGPTGYAWMAGRGE